MQTAGYGHVYAIRRSAYNIAASQINNTIGK